MAEGSETLVLRWAWRHYSLDMDECDSLDEALRMSKALADDGSEALDGIEVWDDNGYRYISGGDALDMAREQFPDEPYEPQRRPVRSRRGRCLRWAPVSIGRRRPHLIALWSFLILWTAACMVAAVLLTR